MATLAHALAELRAEIAQYGEDVAAALKPEPRKAAQRLYSRLAIAYPSGPTATGRRKRPKGRGLIPRDRSLRFGLRMGPVDDQGWFVVTSAPHAHLYEYGTGPRTTAKGWKRGISPKRGPVFIKFAAEARADMIAAIEGHLRSVRLRA